MKPNKATATEHASAILSLAAKADDLIAQLRPVLDEIADHEKAALKALGNPMPMSGQQQLGIYIKSLLDKPIGTQPASELAARAWREFV